MDFAHKAVLTATVVAMVLLAARFFGARVAGLVTGLPIITAPALVWVAIEHGQFAAASVAVGSVAACPVAALFALCYDRMARKAGPSASLAVATLLVGLACFAARELFTGLFVAFAASVLACGLALRCLSRPNDTAPQRSAPRHANLPFTVALASLTGPLSTLGQFDPFLVGLLAGLPVVAATVVVIEHACTGPLAVICFLRGYVAGLAGRAAFGILFALLLTPIGWCWALLAAGAVSALVCALGTSRGRRRHAVAASALTRQVTTLAPGPGASHPQ